MGGGKGIQTRTPAPYMGGLGGKGKGKKDNQGNKGAPGAPRPSAIGSIYGPPSDDWTITPPSPFVAAIPEMRAILEKSSPEWFHTSRPEGYKVRVGDLPPDLGIHDLASRLLGHPDCRGHPERGDRGHPRPRPGRRRRLLGSGGDPGHGHQGGSDSHGGSLCNLDFQVTPCGHPGDRGHLENLDIPDVAWDSLVPASSVERVQGHREVPHGGHPWSAGPLWWRGHRQPDSPAAAS